MAADSGVESALRPGAVTSRIVFAQPVLFTPAVLLPAEWVAVPAPVARARAPRRSGCRAGAGQGVAPASLVPVLLSAVLLLSAALLAPEHPRDQEAICQRHNGVEACRVW